MPAESPTSLGLFPTPLPRRDSFHGRRNIYRSPVDPEGDEHYTHSIYPLADAEQQTSFVVWDLPAGTYDAGDSFDVQATATDMTWSKAWSGIILEY